MIRWRIYYDDGSTFDNRDGEPDDAPGYGVEAIVQYDTKTNRAVLQRTNFYYWHRRDNLWYAADLAGVLDQFTHFPRHVTALKQGRSISTPRFDAILRRATTDPDFPPRSAGRNTLEQTEP